MSTSTSKLSKLLISPQRLANVINWKRASGSTLMCLDITSDRIGIAIASHTRTENTVTHLNALSYKSKPRTQKELVTKIVQSIQDFTKDQRIDGFLVNWPLESDGRFGKSCGKVLHLLDHFAEQKVLSKRIPFALWDGRDVLSANYGISPVEKQSPPDEWGRSVTFALKPPKTLTEYKHNPYSSRDPSNIISEDSSDAAVLLEDYVDCHFDDHLKESTHHNDRKVSPVAAVFRKAFNYHFDSYESQGAYIQAALL